jgi:RHS repeat-associated protein
MRYYAPLLCVLALGGAGVLERPASSVEIHPGTSSVDVTPYSTNTQRFWIVNTATQADQYSIFANVCTPYDLYCSWSNTFLGTIPANDSVPFDVTYTAGHAGTSGVVSFDARLNADQNVRASKSLTVNARQEAHLEVTAFNPGTTEARDLCLTFAVATDAASECGDLRLVHALPSVRVRGTERTPTLLYNSRFAHPFGLVAATLSVPPQNATGVTATLTVPQAGGNVVVTQGFADALFTASSVRKFVMAFDASALPTGVYPYTLRVAMSVGGTPDTLVTSGSLVVVNRQASPFGAGWWLAGYERLYPQGDGSLLWVGGDGSATQYVNVATNVYAATAVDRPDSITVDASGTYVRHLRSGATAEFTASGRHFITRDRLGVATRFHHDQFGQMVNIDPADVASLRYTFTYSGATGPLETVTAPSVDGTPRVVQRTVLADGRIQQHTDPDGTVVTFGYDNGAVPEQITSRTNRRGVTQSFAFDAVGKLVTVRVPFSASDTAVTTFCPAESRGYSSTGCSSGPLHPDSAVTVMDGPRPDTDAVDVTTFRVDRFGAPALIRDALGNQTQLFRGNRAFPGLVTRVVHANGWVNDAFHDQKGLITKLVQYAPLGPGRDAVTEYAWDPKWERVTQITFPERNVMQFAYDSATGNRLWQQDGRGTPSRADFTYNGAGVNGALRLSSVIHPPDAQNQRAVDSITYDALSNVSETRSPTGARTSYTRDAAGRVTATYSDITFGGGIRQRDSTMYDVRDRDTLTSSFGPQVDPNGSPAATVYIRKTWDSEGNLQRLVRWSDPDPAAVGPITTRWRYDLGDRREAEVDTLGMVDSTAYDRAGNARALVTRRGDTLVMTYDAMNRLLSRAVPAVTVDSVRRSIATLVLPNLENPPYPFYPNDGAGGYRVAADTDSFAYDEMGRITSATNATALVTRTYFANGLLESERQRVRTIASVDSGGSFGLHDYTVGYVYDLNGRRTKLAVPASLAPVVGGVAKDTARFAYDSVMAGLTTVGDLLDRPFTYSYDGGDAVTTIAMPGGYEDRFRYTLDGLLSRDSVIRVSGGVFRAKRFVYNDARGKVTQIADSVGFRDTLGTRYSGLGHVDSTFFVTRRDTSVATTWTSAEGFFTDGLANFVQSVRISNIRNRWLGSTTTTALQRYVYDTTHLGRLVADTAGDGVTNFEYDAAGNTRFNYRVVFTNVPSATLEDRASYYGAEGRLRAADYRQVVNGSGYATPTIMAFEEYRYDALGRRVLVRARRQCDFVSDRPKAQCNLDLVRRTVWDGAQELVEIQMPDGPVNGQVDQAERDTGFVAIPPFTLTQGTQYLDPNPYFGRVLYTHGLALDHPVSITRVEYTDNPQSPTGPGGQGASRWAPLSIVPVWNDRGQADLFYFADTSSAPYCRIVSGIPRCVRGSFPFAWFAYDRAASPPREWHGTLVEDKADEAGTLYRRERYYEPTTGRFTQEDPIGLAGGLNLYGFASGDPVNLADPFGLCPIDKPLCNWIEVILTAAGTDIGFIAGGGAGLLAGPAAIAASPAGAFAGAAAGAGIGLTAGKALTSWLFSESSPSRTGGKSAEEYDRHIEAKGKAEERLQELQEQLGQVKGPKAQRPIREAIENLQREIRGHEKEIRQKWPEGRP